MLPVEFWIFMQWISANIGCSSSNKALVFLWWAVNCCRAWRLEFTMFSVMNLDGSTNLVFLSTTLFSGTGSFTFSWRMLGRTFKDDFFVFFAIFMDFLSLFLRAFPMDTFWDETIVKWLCFSTNKQEEILRKLRFLTKNHGLLWQKVTLVKHVHF